MMLTQSQTSLELELSLTSNSEEGKDGCSVTVTKQIESILYEVSVKEVNTTWR